MSEKYRKAMEGYQQSGDKVGLGRSLNNLAGLLQNQANRLDESDSHYR